MEKWGWFWASVVMILEAVYNGKCVGFGLDLSS